MGNPTKPAEDWAKQEVRLLAAFRGPIDIQRWLNRIAYDAARGTRSPRWVMREKKANCLEGALFGAAALRFQGHPPLLVDLRSSDHDDDHVIAVFRRGGRWGALAKSNYTTLRFREPVFLSVRELVMSYFEGYFNPWGEKTLREYSRPFNLSRFDRLDWMTTDKDLNMIGQDLDHSPHRKVMTPAMIRSLERADPGLVKAGLLGAKKEGLFKPQKG
ncbi:MAG: hypothetical protein WCB96_05475 [Candidatus Aminicenantales bacterium]